MSKAYSIAEARNQLSRVVHEAENTGEVQLTRRGKPVAVVLSMDEYRRLNGSPRESVWSVIEQAHAGLQLLRPAQQQSVRPFLPARASNRQCLRGTAQARLMCLLCDAAAA